MLKLRQPMLSIFGSDYASQADTMLAVLALSVFPVAINHIVISLLRVMNSLRGILLLSLLMAISTTILAYPFIQDHGILGIGLGLRIGQMATGIAGVTLILASTHRSRIKGSISEETT